MIIAGYQFHLDALLARIVYRWRRQTLLGAAALALLVAGLSGHIPPFWRGRAILSIQAAPGAAVTVDERPWTGDDSVGGLGDAGVTGRLYAGAHTIIAALPDGRRAWVQLTMRAEETTTLILPPGLAAPRELRLPAAAPGMAIQDIWRAGSVWHVRSAAPPVLDTDGSDMPDLMPATQTVAVSARGVERLTTIDAYRGLADLVVVGDTRYEAVYEPALPGVRSQGLLVVRGWNSAPLTMTSELSFVRFAPDGNALVFGERATAGTQLSYVARGQAPASLVAVPGTLTGLAWRPDGGALLIASKEGDRRALTLARLNPAPVAAVIAEPAVAGLPAFAWADDHIVWIALDDSGEEWLWRAAIDTLLPERGAPLNARALTVLPDGALRVVMVIDGEVVIGRWRDGLLIGEATLHETPAAADLIGEWYGNEILLRSGERAWFVTMAEGD